jgi:hypothetical protein
MKFFGIWTLLVALVISVTAAYYSIVGLVAIFAASAIPVIIMGSALEVGKLTTAVWLHLFWKESGFLIKTYLSIALLLLMFITSMGIFGFLSKAHIEQTAVATESQAVLARVESDIKRLEETIVRSEQKIVKFENADSEKDSSIQEKINEEESRIQTLYDRFEKDSKSLKDNFDEAIKPYNEQLDGAEKNIRLTTEYVNQNAIRQLQGLIGSRQDGRYGSKTAAKVEEFRSNQTQIRDAALGKISEERKLYTEELSRLRENVESQVEQANNLINRLRNQLGTASDKDVAELVDAERLKIINSENSINDLLDKKFKIESENRKLEAEVGPVKYLAELIYGEEMGTALIEKAVRWVILVLVAVFDPLAVVLVIAGISVIERHSKKGDDRDVVLLDNDKETNEVEEDRTVYRKSDEQVEEIIEEVSNDEISDEISDEVFYVRDSVSDENLKEQLDLNKVTREKRLEETKNKLISRLKYAKEFGIEIPAFISLDDKEINNIVDGADQKTLDALIKEIDYIINSPL